MTELQTFLGVEIPIETRAILYLCELTNRELLVKKEMLFDDPIYGYNAYANIPNPESQLMVGNTYDELIREVHKLHKIIKTPKFVADLRECI